MTITEYIDAVKADYMLYFPLLTLVVAGAEVEDLPVPGVILRIANIEPGMTADMADVTMELILYWQGPEYGTIVMQLWSWVYRRFCFHTIPVGEPGEYDPEKGAVDYSISWKVMIENDYTFNPLPVDNVLIREVITEVEIR